MAAIPVAGVVGKCAYVAHGGLFRSPASVRSPFANDDDDNYDDDEDKYAPQLGCINDLMQLKRMLHDPNPNDEANLDNLVDHTLIEDVMWSDPGPQHGLYCNTTRGCGLVWGSDITRQFLEQEGLTMIIRSHEGPDSRNQRREMKPMIECGYTVDHETPAGTCCTIFSAPDYPQWQASQPENRFNNNASFLRLNHAIVNGPVPIHPLVVTYDAVKPRPKSRPYYNYLTNVLSDVEFESESEDSDDKDN